MAVTFSVNALIMAIITQYWKISVHMAVLSSVATGATILYGTNFAWIFLVLLPLGWARIHRKRHTFWQVVAGSLLSFILTGAVFMVMGYL